MLKGLLGISAIFLLAAMTAISGCDSAEQAQGTQQQAAPDFTLDNYLDQGPAQVSLDDYRGQVVVLEWFNYDCPFVQYHYQQSQTMIQLVDKYADQDVVWLAIDSASSPEPEQNRRFADESGISYPILDDRSGQVGRAYGATRTPEMFVIDADGQIVYGGAIDNAPLGNVAQGQEYVNYVDLALTELLAGEEISTPSTEPYGCTVKY